MALYIGGKKCKMMAGRDACSINIVSIRPVTQNILLISSDNHMLRDINGIYLTVKEDSGRIMSTDGYILKDSNELFLITKEGE